MTPDPPMTPTAVRVIAVEILAIFLLWAAQRHFGA
jgi:hypothetical protein